jgi:thioredoxin reductase (NADPH)
MVHLDRQPFLVETSRPGVFAVGDVRSGSTRMVAPAVGEGGMAVRSSRNIWLGARVLVVST